jgi:hypothetical protein
LQQPGRATMLEATEKPPTTRRLRKRRWIGPAALLLLLALGGLMLAYRADQFFQMQKLSHSQDTRPGSAAIRDSGDQGKDGSEGKVRVAPQLLDDSRRVAVLQRDFELVQAKFDAGQVNSGDYYAARGLWLEARIKLAVAEQKPLNDLLDELVENRMEELKFAELLFEAGKGLENDVLLAKAHLDDARARLSAAGGGGDALKVQDLIVGAWRAERILEEKDDKLKLNIITIRAKFTADGKFKYEQGDDDKTRIVEGTYKLLNDHTIETTATEPKMGRGPQKTVIRKFKIESLTRTRLIVVDEKGERIDFYRVK